jgi:hypothetical protein
MVHADQRELASVMGINGYPGGTVSRAFRFEGTGRNTWEQRTERLIASYSPYDVQVEYSIDGTTLTAKVTVTADSDINEQIAVNLIVLEDGLTGSGSQWDQRNFLSGRNGYQGNPYYEKPDPITGYIHDNVVWAYAGGLWGDTEGVPATMMAGESFEKTFTWDISSESRVQNADNLWVVGMVQDPNQGEILNAAMIGKEGHSTDKEPVVLEMTELSDKYIVNQAGNQVTRTINIKNPTNQTFNLDVNTLGSFNPNGWSDTTSITTAVLAPGEELNFDVVINDGSAAGLGISRLVIEAEAGSLTENQFSKSLFEDIYVLSDKTKNAFFYGFNQAPNTVLSFIGQGSGFFQDLALVPANVKIFDNFDFQMIETAVVEVSDASSQAMATGSGDGVRSVLTGLIENGIDVLYSGSLNLFWASEFQTATTPSENALDFYDMLGIQINQQVPYFALVANQQLRTANVVGLNYLNGLTATGNGLYSQNYPVYDQLAEFISPTEGNSFLNLGHVAGLTADGAQLTPEQTCVIAGIEKGESKIAFMTLSIEALGPQANAAAMVGKLYEWLKTDSQGTGGAVISVSNDLNFGVVTESTTENVMISNTGDESLTIATISVNSDDNSQFTIDGNYAGSVVEPGSSLTVPVTFAASVDGKSTAELDIMAEGDVDGKTVMLSGEKLASSVSNTIENVLSLDATPNTFETTTNLNVNIVSPSNVNITLVDINGNNVANIFSGQLTASTTQVIDATNLSAGKYFVVADVDGKIARVAVIVE